MALKKPILLPNGVTVNYHRISAIKLDCPYSIMITVDSYITESARAEQKNIESNEVEVGTTFPYMDSDIMFLSYSTDSLLMNGPIMEKAYDYLKQTDKFKDAVDA